jgi:spore maturation protein CgeB
MWGSEIVDLLLVIGSDERDLVEKVKYYLNNDEARGRIAQTGWLKASTCYTPKNFWKAIVEEYENLQ